MTDLPFPNSLPEFQRLFPDDAACARYLEQIRWRDGFVCACGHAADPARITTRPHVLRCRKCRKETRLTAGTVMQDSHTALSTWFWGAYLLSSMTPGMSAVQFQRQLGLGRYETAFQMLHKLRAGMVRHDQDKIGGNAGDHVEVDETWIGGRTRGEGKGTHHKTLVAAAVEVRMRKPKEKDVFGEQSKAIPRRGGRYAGRLRLSVATRRTAKVLVPFVEHSVAPGAMIVTDDWSAYDGLEALGYQHLPVAERGEAKVAEEYLPIVHLIFSNLKSWLLGVHHGVSPQHLQTYLNEFTFRFNRRFYPFNAFRSLLGIGAGAESPTYRELYDGEWKHPNLARAGGGE